MLRHLVLLSMHYSEQCLDFRAMTGHFIGDAGSECRIGRCSERNTFALEMHIHSPPSQPHMRHEVILAVAKETGEL